jgi:hypothetical protein
VATQRASRRAGDTKGVHHRTSRARAYDTPVHSHSHNVIKHTVLVTTCARNNGAKSGGDVISVSGSELHSCQNDETWQLHAFAPDLAFWGDFTVGNGLRPPPLNGAAERKRRNCFARNRI